MLWQCFPGDHGKDAMAFLGFWDWEPYAKSVSTHTDRQTNNVNILCNNIYIKIYHIFMFY